MSSKEEFLKIQTCILKVNIHCDGCKQKVKKILQKIDGVFTTKIEAEQGKVTVSGNVEPSVLIKKLSKCGKHAELWITSQKPNNIQLDNAKVLTNNNNHKQNNNNHNQPKALQQNNLQQLQQIKSLPDMMPQSNDRTKALQDVMSQLKGQKLPPNQPNQKSLSFASLKDDVDCSGDELDEFDEDDDGFNDDDGLVEPNLAVNKMKPSMPPMVGSNGSVQAMPAINPHLMNVHKGGAPPQHGGGNGKQGGGPIGVVPFQINGGIKGSGSCANNQNGGNPGGGKPQNIKGGNGGGGGGAAGGFSNGFGGGGVNGSKDNNMNAVMSQVGNMNLRPNGNMPMGHMGNIPTVHGLPASATTSNRGGGRSPNGAGGYFQGARPDPMSGNPQKQQQQQQYLAAMMNQQKALGVGTERFQPMMYARTPPIVNYMSPIPNLNPNSNPNPNPDPYPYQYQYQYQHPYPYPYASQHGPDPYSNMFNDESTSSCNVM